MTTRNIFNIQTLLLAIAILSKRWSHAVSLASFDHCDNNSIHEDVPLARISTNSFIKICPHRTNSTPSKLGSYPLCGDGSSFSFYLTRPTQRYLNNHKLLIEFQGGGACWDSQTCEMQQQMLTFPTVYDNILGLGCSEINYGVTHGIGNSNTNYNTGELPISILCSKTVGGANFASYNTIIVPYCTQDVHVGNNYTSYSDSNVNDDDLSKSGGSLINIAHHGGHNLFAVLRYIYKNFPHPSHIVLTGCSAGGTVLPIAYDLLNKHYNTMLNPARSVQISTMIDSPVYLTPEYFLKYSLNQWNPWDVMDRIQFNYKKYRYDTSYPTYLWDHVLKRGQNGDRWGFVTHTQDDVSLIYYEWMSGNGNNINRFRRDLSKMQSLQGEQLLTRGLEGSNGNDDASEYSQWWEELSSSLSSIQSKHSNVYTYYIDGDGHCTFGLYYALQAEGFDTFASAIFGEKRVWGRMPVSIIPFLLSILIGGSIVAGSIYEHHQRRSIINDKCFLDDELLPPHHLSTKQDGRYHSSMVQRMTNVYAQCGRYPITTGYLTAATIYFISMIVFGGWAHPINNPSLGPSAHVLSSFGINNPSLIVYKQQWWRLFTSSLLCSGVLTYIMVLWCVWKNVRSIECAVDNSPLFGSIILCIVLGGNIIYGLFGNGASCAALGVVLGLQTFSIIMNLKLTRMQFKPEETDNDSVGRQFPRPIASTVAFWFIASVVFPFNSWMLLVSSMVFGGLAMTLCRWVPEDSKPATSKGSKSQSQLNSRRVTPILNTPIFYIMCSLLAISAIIALPLRKPNVVYQNHNLTGCDLVCTTQVKDIVSGNYFKDNERRLMVEKENTSLIQMNFLRKLNGGNDDYVEQQQLCAQLCVPHIVYRPVLWGVSRFVDFEVLKGTCENQGFGEHVADKTFRQMALSIDVEIYTSLDDTR